MSATSIDTTDATTALPNEGVGSKQSNHRYAWFVAGMLSLAYLLSLVDRYILGVTLEAVKADLHLNDTQLGILQGPSFVFLYVAASIPLLPSALELARAGVQTRGLATNRAYAAPIFVAPGIDPALLDVLHDPQTSGGLLLSLAPDSVSARRLAARPDLAVMIGVVEPFSGTHILVT